LGVLRPTHVLEAEIQHWRADLRFNASSRCRRRPDFKLREFCDRLAESERELIAARGADLLEAAAARLRKEVEELAEQGGARPADRQAHLIGSFVGLAEARLGDLIGGLTALVIELVGGFGVYLSVALLIGDNSQQPGIKPAPRKHLHFPESLQETGAAEASEGASDVGGSPQRAKRARQGNGTKRRSTGPSSRPDEE
jgi:hypothetical protein